MNDAAAPKFRFDPSPNLCGVIWLLLGLFLSDVTPFPGLWPLCLVVGLLLSQLIVLSIVLSNEWEWRTPLVELPARLVPWLILSCEFHPGERAADHPSFWCLVVILLTPLASHLAAAAQRAVLRLAQRRVGRLAIVAAMLALLGLWFYDRPAPAAPAAAPQNAWPEMRTLLLSLEPAPRADPKTFKIPWGDFCEVNQPILKRLTELMETQPWQPPPTTNVEMTGNFDTESLNTRLLVDGLYTCQNLARARQDANEDFLPPLLLGCRLQASITPAQGPWLSGLAQSRLTLLNFLAKRVTLLDSSQLEQLETQLARLTPMIELFRTSAPYHQAAAAALFDTAIPAGLTAKGVACCGGAEAAESRLSALGSCRYFYKPGLTRHLCHDWDIELQQAPPLAGPQVPSSYQHIHLRWERCGLIHSHGRYTPQHLVLLRPNSFGRAAVSIVIMLRFYALKTAQDCDTRHSALRLLIAARRYQLQTGRAPELSDFCAVPPHSSHSGEPLEWNPLQQCVLMSNYSCGKRVLESFPYR